MLSEFGWFISGTSTVVSMLLSLKLVEMLAHVIVVWRIPRSLVDQLGDPGIPTKTHLLEQCRAAWDPKRWMFTHFVLRFPKLLRWPSNLVFRWPSLMTIQALLLIVVRQHAVTMIACALLIAGVWLELLQRFLFRLRLGHLDTYIRGIASDCLDPEFQQAFNPAHDLDLVTDFVLLFGRLVAVVILGYAAVYSALQLALSPNAFSGNLGAGSETVFSLLYFSVVTIATVGYGDIVPSTMIARFLVASEIMAGFALLVLLVTAFALTASSKM